MDVPGFDGAAVDGSLDLISIDATFDPGHRLSKNIGGRIGGNSLSRPYLVFIRHGPTWKLDGLVFLAEVLSRRWGGEIWTFSYDQAGDEEVVGSFRIRRDRVFWRLGPLGKLLHLLRLTFRGLRLRWLEGRRLLVITYDPLMNGIIGVVLKYLARARFICEVNGVYDNPDNLADLGNPDAARKKLKAMTAVAARVLSHADHIKLLFPTQVDGYAGIPPSIPRTTFANLVDGRRFRYVERDPEPILVFVGYPFLLKGGDVLLKAFARVRSDFPEWRLVIIGHRNRQAALALKLPTESVEFLDPQPQEAISDWFERCSALILPSRSEAMGRVLIEAALKGRGRIGSRTGGIPHYINDGVDGLLFQAGDVDDLERTLRRFLSDAAAPRRMGAAARSRAEVDFTPEAYLEAYSRILDEVWGGRTRSGPSSTRPEL
jgi:glycosyltransferase involved in cell wall biosynthesis